MYNRFIQTLFLRPSCGKCIFANLNRLGDITIADFKKKYELLPEVKGYENLSTIIVNTEKGAEVFAKLKEILKIYPANLDNVARENPPLRLPSKMNKNRDSFFNDLRNGIPIEQVLTKYIAVPALQKRLWLYIPDKIRARIKRWVRWVKQ